MRPRWRALRDWEASPCLTPRRSSGASATRRCSTSSSSSCRRCFARSSSCARWRISPTATSARSWAYPSVRSCRDSPGPVASSRRLGTGARAARAAQRFASRPWPACARPWGGLKWGDMDAADNPAESAKLHVSTLLIASERALTNALDELGFAQDDDRVVQHEGRLAFLTCSHDPDCDDLFALISELAARGETWELQFRIDTGEGRAVFQRLARHQSVEAVDAELPPETEETGKELPVHDLDSDAGRATLRKALNRVDPA